MDFPVGYYIIYKLSLQFKKLMTSILARLSKVHNCWTGEQTDKQDTRLKNR